MSEHSFPIFALERVRTFLSGICTATCRFTALRDICAKFRLHSPLCALLWHKTPANCDAHLPESNFQTRSGAGMSGSGSLPTAGGSAWKNQSAVGYRKADFVSGNRAAEVLGNHRVKHIGKHGRLKSGSVGID